MISKVITVLSKTFTASVFPMVSDPDPIYADPDPEPGFEIFADLDLGLDFFPNN